MRRLVTTGNLLVIIFFLCACATSHRYSVIEPSKKELTDYRILEIRDFKSNLGDNESKELAARFADRLYQNILKDRQEYPNQVIFDDVVRQTNKTEGVLLLDGAVISFEKGSRAARYIIGFGAGKAYCTIQSVFTDKTTKEPILKLNFDGELSMGVFGGSADEAVQAVVIAYLDYFDDYFENQLAQIGKDREQSKKVSDHSTETQKVATIPKDVSIVRVTETGDEVILNSDGTWEYSDKAKRATKKEAETEIWELQLTDEVVGNLKMLLKRVKIDNEIYSITGDISGNLRDYRAGAGTGQYKLEGKIEKGIFKANFGGISDVEVGPSPTSGRLNGTVYKSKGSGKYSVLHAFGSSHGDYIMIQRANPSIKVSDHSKETLKVASIPKDVSNVRVSLRKKPMMISNEERINNMLVKYGFFDTSKNALGDFDNHFIDNNDGTITDKATGLIWQKNGSTNSLDNRSAKEYVTKLNQRKFAGHSNWRIPTVEELASLIKKVKAKGVHIDPVFDNKQITCWTADPLEPAYQIYQLGAWIVSFRKGEVLPAIWANPDVRSSSGIQSDLVMMEIRKKNYVKSVCSIKLQ